MGIELLRADSGQVTWIQESPVPPPPPPYACEDAGEQRMQLISETHAVQQGRGVGPEPCGLSGGHCLPLKTAESSLWFLWNVSWSDQRLWG